jgi:hypothetical protein
VFEREAVARFLVPAVAEVLHVRVDDRLRQRPGERGGLVGARVVNEDDQVHDPLRKHFGVRLLQGLGRVVRGHDDDDFFVAEHFQLATDGAQMNTDNESRQSDYRQFLGFICAYLCPICGSFFRGFSQ